jgi:hypothetical protein
MNSMLSPIQDESGNEAANVGARGSATPRSPGRRRPKRAFASGDSRLGAVGDIGNLGDRGFGRVGDVGNLGGVGRGGKPDERA